MVEQYRHEVRSCRDTGGFFVSISSSASSTKQRSGPLDSRLKASCASTVPPLAASVVAIPAKRSLRGSDGAEAQAVVVERMT